MDGIKLFKDNCARYGISFDEIFFSGKGGEIHGRCVFKLCENVASKQIPQKYVIKYWSEDDIFVVWQVLSLRKNYYSVSADKIKGIHNDQIISVTKPIEYSGRGEETVYAFKHTMIPEFLEQVVLKHLR